MELFDSEHLRILGLASLWENNQARGTDVASAGYVLPRVPKVALLGQHNRFQRELYEMLSVYSNRLDGMMPI